jgi:glycine oxidase
MQGMNSKPRILVKGAGVAGMTACVELAERGGDVTLYDQAGRVGAGASWFAGGMLAPWCEAESAPEEVTAQSVGAVDWWARHVPQVTRQGSLVLAPARDVGEIARFARRTSHFTQVNGAEIAELEPDLDGRFQKGLFFEQEGHVDPRVALHTLFERLLALGGHALLSGAPAPDETAFDWVVDCTGLVARDRLDALRGVRGEMLLLRCRDVSLHRPVRMLHPRIPVYIVPRADHIFMVGATMVESEDTGGMTVRSMLELLNAAYTLHPGFAEAEILETGIGVRPSYPDNIPRVTQDGKYLFINGMYRHGFLLSPARAEEAADRIFGRAA